MQNNFSVSFTLMFRTLILKERYRPTFNKIHQSILNLKDVRFDNYLNNDKTTKRYIIVVPRARVNNKTPCIY